MEIFKNLPVKGFIETSFVDWPGKLCAVVFFARCNFRCRYCHNADLVLRPDSVETIDSAAISKRLQALKGWVDGVCVSGGEPTLHESLPQVLASLKEAGFLTKLDTNGSNPEILRALITAELVDYVAMDVKSCLNEPSYCKITQAPHMMDAVRKSIGILIDGKVEYEFRVTVVPSYHGPEDIYKLATELNGAACLRIQNFRPDHTLDPGMKTIRPYTDETITMIQQRVDQLISTP